MVEVMMRHMEARRYEPDMTDRQALEGMMPEKELHTHDSIPCFICDEDCSVCIRNKALTDSAKKLSEQVASEDYLRQIIAGHTNIDDIVSELVGLLICLKRKGKKI